MIKLIAIDVDGTLLQHGEQKISKRTLDCLAFFIKKGIKICLASGRQYPNLLQLVEHLAKDIYFVSENGCAVFVPKADQVHEAEKEIQAEYPLHRLIYADVIDKKVAFGLIKEMHENNMGETVISDPYCCYVFNHDSKMLDSIENDWNIKIQKLNNEENLPSDIVKISSYVYKDVLVWQEKMKPKWGQMLNVAVSGPKWIDFNRGNKARGLEFLAKHLGIGMENIMAFGDNYNDVEMLESVGEAYLMSHANEELRQIFKQQTPSVMDVLEPLMKKIELE